MHHGTLPEAGAQMQLRPLATFADHLRGITAAAHAHVAFQDVSEPNFLADTVCDFPDGAAYDNDVVNDAGSVSSASSYATWT